MIDVKLKCTRQVKIIILRESKSKGENCVVIIPNIGHTYEIW